MQRRLTAVAITAIALQCLIIFFASTRFSFFIGDDLGAAALMHHVDFWSFIAAPVDIHRVPLHRLVNYLLQTLFPMNFAAATAFMLACHAASLFVLYRLLQRINPSQLNLCLILAYALSGYVYIAMHWWSAALHRLPYILGAVISCYGFWRFHQQRRMAFAALTIGGQVIAAGFFVKAVLIPAYWAAMLFCVMNFRDWKKYRRDYALIACGATLSLAYMGWYVHDNHYNVIAVNNPGLILRTSLQLGFSTIAQMLLQMRLSTELAPWINLAFVRRSSFIRSARLASSGDGISYAGYQSANYCRLVPSDPVRSAGDVRHVLLRRAAFPAGDFRNAAMAALAGQNKRPPTRKQNATTMPA